MSDSPPLITGLGDIAHDYDALIIDLWGVIHGGVKPHPGALDTLARLRSEGKRTALLSNVPRRAAVIAGQLDAMGVTSGMYDLLLTSGQAAHEALADPDEAHRALGSRPLIVGPYATCDVLDGLDFEPAATVDEADFILCVGLYDETAPLSDLDGLLARARERDLVMMCVNPDLVVQSQDGHVVVCAGSVAAAYKAVGGEVIYHGKPDPAVFHACAAGMGARDSGRILVVGDSLINDIPGARAAGFDALWVTRGIHAGALGITPGETPTASAMAAVCREHGQRPNAAIASFLW